MSARVVAFKNSPFPYEGDIPEQDNKAFLDHDSDGRAFHDSPRGGRLYADRTFNDPRSLLMTTPGFDPKKPGARLIVFFHGNCATLKDVMGRQGVPRQIVASHLDAALVAPQLAVDALDSSAGRFWTAGFFETYLHEAAVHLAEGRTFTPDDIDRLPVVIVAYSGGYLPTAFTLLHARTSARIEGVVLLDALFGEEEKFASWVRRTRGAAFFVSGYSNASSPLNARLKSDLEVAGLQVESSLPPRIIPDTVALIAVPQAVHNDFVTRAWTRDPLTDILRRLRTSP